MRKILLSLVVLLVCSISFGQVHFSDDFEDNDISDWTLVDSDGDANNWQTINASNISDTFGSYSMFSYSWWNSVVYTPDNLAISSAIDLSGVTAENLFLIYDVVSHSSYPDKYALYVTTSNDPTTILASSPLIVEAPGALLTKRIDFSDYAGQVVYLTFRHYDSEDLYYLIVDNISVATVSDNDVNLKQVNVDQFTVLNEDNTLSMEVENLGATTVTSLEVNWNDGTDHVSTISTNIAFGETQTVEHPIAVNYSDLDTHSITVTVTQANGAADPNMSNNVKTASTQAVSQASTKKVLFEEGTGTWCGYCPRGAVAMEYMETTYADQFVGVAVHNSDPMQLDEYNTGAAISGFPGMNVDRVLLGEGVSIEEMEGVYLQRKDLSVPVALGLEGSVSGQEVTLNANAIFRTNLSDIDYRLGVIISEDNVTGSTSDYDQVNYYAGGSLGEMGGYESLANPVPASQMVYNHVGRALLGGYSGQEGSVPTSVTDGQEVNYTFNYTLPSDADVNNFHAIVVLIDQSSGAVINAESVEISSLMSVADTELQGTKFVAYPNPATDVVNLKMVEGDYTMGIYNVAGKLVKSQKINTHGETVTVSVSDLAKGVYVITLANKEQSFSKKLIIK